MSVTHLEILNSSSHIHTASRAVRSTFLLSSVRDGLHGSPLLFCVYNVPLHSYPSMLTHAHGPQVVAVLPGSLEASGRFVFNCSVCPDFSRPSYFVFVVSDSGGVSPCLDSLTVLSSPAAGFSGPAAGPGTPPVSTSGRPTPSLTPPPAATGTPTAPTNKQLKVYKVICFPTLSALL